MTQKMKLGAGFPQPPVQIAYTSMSRGKVCGLSRKLSQEGDGRRCTDPCWRSDDGLRRSHDQTFQPGTEYGLKHHGRKRRS